MPTRCLIAVCLLVLVSTVGATAHTLPAGGAVDGWAHDGPQRRFTAANLYGHINGGAELFLELGFRDLLVQSYRNGEREITVECYRMESPLAALAIYLFKCGEETPWPEIEARNSSSRFQATILRGNSFIMVNSFSGDAALRPAMTGLAGKLLASVPPARLEDPFLHLPREYRIGGTERLIRGEYSLQALYTLGPGDVLQLGGEIFGVAADYTVPGDNPPVSQIRVTYPDVTRAEKAFAHLLAVLDPALEPLEKRDDLLVFRDFAGRYGQVVCGSGVIDVRVNLTVKP